MPLSGMWNPSLGSTVQVLIPLAGPLPGSSQSSWPRQGRRCLQKWVRWANGFREQFWSPVCDEMIWSKTVTACSFILLWFFKGSFIKKNFCICLIFGCAKSSLLCRLFSSCSARASHCSGFSCGAWALGAWASVVKAHGLRSCGS